MLLERRLSDGELRDLLTDRRPTCDRERPDIQLRRCPLDGNAWSPRGSLAAGRCLCCGLPFREAA